MLTEVHHNKLVASARDLLLDELRRHAPNLPEIAQRDAAARFAEFVRELVNDVAMVIATQEFAAVPVVVEDANLKGKITLSMSAVTDWIGELAEHKKGAAALVLIDPARFDRERWAPPVNKDQPDLPIDEQPAAEATADGEQQADEPPTAEEPAPQGEPAPTARPRTTEFDKVRAYFAGYDSCKAGQSVTERPEWVKAKKTLAKAFDQGWADCQQEKPAAWNRPATAPVAGMPPADEDEDAEAEEALEDA